MRVSLQQTEPNLHLRVSCWVLFVICAHTQQANKYISNHDKIGKYQHLRKHYITKELH